MTATVLTLRRAVNHSEKVTTIHEMLLRYDEAQAEAFSGGGSGGRAESRINAFDEGTWTREYQELERTLIRLRWLAEHDRPILERNVSASKAWWHLRERYLHSRTVRREVHLDRNHSRTERRPVKLPAHMEVVARQTILHGRTSHMLVRVWDPNVDPAVVGVALRFLAREYAGEPAVYRETAA